LPSVEVIDDGRIGDGAWLDQPASAAMVAPQPIFSGELMESMKFKEFEDIRMATRRTVAVSSCSAVMRNSTEDRVKAGKTPEVELEMKRTMKSSKVKKVKLKTKRTMKKLMTDRTCW